MQDTSKHRVAIRSGGWFAAVVLAVALAGGHAAAQTTSYFLIAKGEVWTQTGAGTPVLAAKSGAIFDAEAPSFGGPVIVSSAVLTLPGGATRAMALSDDSSTYFVRATNDTVAALDAAYPAGNYSIALASSFLPGLNATIALPADGFPPPPTIGNFTAAQSVDSTSDFTLTFSPFAGAAAPDDATLEVYDQSGALWTSYSVDPSTTNVVISANDLNLGTTYEGVLRFRAISAGSAGLATPAHAFFSENHFTLATAGANKQTNPPVLLSFAPTNGQFNLGKSLALKFDQPMDTTKVSIQWKATLNGAALSLNAADFNYLWADNQTLACFYGSFGADWPPGAVISWALNPVSGAAGNFASAAGVALPANMYSGSFVDVGGPWDCAAEVANLTEAPGFSLVKAANYVQTSDNPPNPDATAPAQALGFISVPLSTPTTGGGSSALFPLLTTAEQGYPEPVYAFTGMPSAYATAYNYTAGAAGVAALDAAYPAGNYVFQIDTPNPSNPQSLPIVKSAASVHLGAGSYPPAPQFTNAAPINPGTIAQGLTLSWIPWAAAGSNALVELAVLDASSNVVFHAPDSCAGVPLPPTAGSVLVPANILSDGASYSLRLAFKTLSDSGKSLTNFPGFGYAALASVTRMDLSAYLRAAHLPPGPTVSISAPASGGFVPAGAVFVTVAAAQPQGALASLQLFDAGTHLLGAAALTAGQSTFAGAISGTLTPGAHSLTVVATDSFGQTALAGPIQLTAQSPAYHVAITSPTAGAVFPPYGTIPLSATATSPNGAISNIDFFVDGVLVGAGASGNVSVPLPEAAPGVHQVVAHAYDVQGFGAASAAVAFTVSAPPTNQIAPFFSTNGALAFGFAGAVGSNYVLEATTDLTPPIAWTPIQSRKLASGGGVFDDPAFTGYTNRFYRLIPLSPSLTNAPAFTVSGDLDAQQAGADTYSLLNGALVTVNGANGTNYTLAVPSGALAFTQPVTLTLLTNLQDNPFAGPILAGADIEAPENSLLIPATLTLQIPAGVPASQLVAFTFRPPAGEMFLTPFSTTNVVAGAATNELAVIPVSHFGVYGLAAFTASDFGIATNHAPSDPSDHLDHSTALALLKAAGAPIAGVVYHGKGGAAAGRAPARPKDDNQALVQQFLDQFDAFYPGMQSAAASGDYGDSQFSAWQTWINDVYESGLLDSLSIQVTQFAQAEAGIYLARLNHLIQHANQQHDWQSIMTLMQFDLANALNSPVVSLGWPAGQPEAIQQAVDDCLTFEFDFDSQMDLSGTATGTSHLKAQVTFPQGNSGKRHATKGQATPEWVEATFVPPQCSAATASPTTPPFLMFGFNVAGTVTPGPGGRKIYNVTGIQAILWPSDPEENFVFICQGYPADGPDTWLTGFGAIYLNDVGAFPSHPGAGDGPPQAAFTIGDAWQVQGGGGNPVLATRTGDGEYSGDNGTLTETSTYQLKHTPQ